MSGIKDRQKKIPIEGLKEQGFMGVSDLEGSKQTILRTYALPHFGIIRQ